MHHPPPDTQALWSEIPHHSALPACLALESDKWWFLEQHSSDWYTWTWWKMDMNIQQKISLKKFFYGCYGDWEWFQFNFLPRVWWVYQEFDEYQDSCLRCVTWLTLITQTQDWPCKCDQPVSILVLAQRWLFDKTNSNRKKSQIDVNICACWAEQLVANQEVFFFF